MTPKKFWLICAAAIVGVLILIVVFGNTGSNTGPSLAPGSATASQICQSIVGDNVTNTDTGQNTGETVENSAYQGGAWVVPTATTSSPGTRRATA